MKANQLWGEVLDNAAFEAEQMGKSLTVLSAVAVAALWLTQNAGKRALENIVRNALRYIHIRRLKSASRDKDGITITVDDERRGAGRQPP